MDRLHHTRPGKLVAALRVEGTDTYWSLAAADCGHALLHQVEGGPDGDAAHFAFDFYAMHGRGGGGNDMGEGPVVTSEDAEGESRRCGSHRFFCNNHRDIPGYPLSRS